MGRTRHVRIALLGLLLVSVATPSRALLTFVEEQRNGVAGVDGLNGARGVIVSPDGAHVYAIGILADAIVAFARASTTGGLTFLQILQDGVDGVDGLDGATQLSASPDGQFVYVASGADDAVAIFRRDASSGLLSFVSAELGVGAAHGSVNGVWSVGVSPDGNNVYVGADGPQLVVYARNAVDGTLSEIDAEGSGRVSFVAFNPDGSRLYAIGPFNFVTFVRDASGALTFLAAALPVDSPSFIAAAGAAAANGDVYVAADRQIPQPPMLYFLRPGAGPGQLDTIQQLQGGPGSGGGLTGARGIALSADGKFVFVAGLGSNVTVFRRATNGMLEFVETQGMSLSTVFSLAVSPDSRHLYVAGAGSSNVAVFSLVPVPDPREVPALSIAGVGVMIVAFAMALWRGRRSFQVD